MAGAIRHISPARQAIPGKNHQLTVIIPAAGIGKRMKSVGNKSLLTLSSGKSVIRTQIDTIRNIYQHCDFFVVVGFQADRLRSELPDNIRFIHNPIYENTNTTFSIGLALQANLNPHVLVVNGDIVFNQETIENITNGGSKIMVDANGHMKEEGVGVVSNDSKHITNLSYGVGKKWCEIFYMQEKELALMKKIALSSDSSKWLAHEALNRVIDDGGTFESIESPSSIVREIDTISDLEIAKRNF